MDMAALKAIVHEISSLAGPPQTFRLPPWRRHVRLPNRHYPARRPPPNYPNSRTITNRLPPKFCQWEKGYVAGSKEPSETVLLTFDKALPARVTIIALSFPVLTYYPSPYKCSKCWRLGHTRNHCNNPSATCKNCGTKKTAPPTWNYPLLSNTPLTKTSPSKKRAHRSAEPTAPRIQQFEEKLTNRFDKIKHLLLTRLPAPKANDDPSNHDSDSSSSSNATSKSSNTSSQIQVRNDYTTSEKKIKPKTQGKTNDKN
ncbi:Uncharacterized protein APZ42_014688 [Daphnia magna]|uniref:CCHC-type domain-containing protein n=1 Tax=Daphnia magna TaxID=35525 RepID=A0A162PNT7_9CRUS|nr:Uncharacterized protein APZ42_014688 [Daphnia magna]